MADATEPLTIQEAAKILNMTAAGLYSAIHRGDLQYVEKYGRKLVRPIDLRRYRQRVRIGRPRNGRSK